MYYLLLLTTLVLSNINSFSTNFFQSNSKFLSSNIKTIEFDYSVTGSMQLEIIKKSQGTANLIISDTCYKISMISPQYHNITISNGTTQTSYNSRSNQIFIENSNFKIDSLIFNFFNNIETYVNQYFFLDTSSNNIIESIVGDFKINFFTNNYAIDSVIISSNKEQLGKVSLFNVKLSEYDNNNFEALFNINKPNAFILDLRD